jgi:nucleotidyltransferase substrate binding protein (TIGR01987 family)
MDKNVDLSTEYAENSIKILEKSYEFLLSAKKPSIEYEIYRNSTIKCFEVTLEQIGKLLRKKIKPYFSSSKEVDRLNYKDVFRHALKHGLLTKETVERWFVYRDNRNDTAHDYGESFAEETVALLKDFIPDAKKMIELL